ncbi:MAG: ribosome-associated translation inhibitor RaiA [Phycisphaerales bacterium]|nr:ribosome-associated translation inhibitor RaiA [Phycisphaerales bacterium]
MNIVIEARHMEVTDSIRDYIETKAEKLPKYYDNIHSIEVTLDMEADQPMSEIIVHGGKKTTFVASTRNEDMYACVDQSLHKIAEQLRRHKDRVRGHHAPTKTSGNEPTEL